MRVVAPVGSDLGTLSRLKWMRVAKMTSALWGHRCLFGALPRTCVLSSRLIPRAEGDSELSVDVPDFDPDTCPFPRQGVETDLAEGAILGLPYSSVYGQGSGNP